MTHVRNNAFRESRETVIEEAELNKSLEKARSISNEYFRLRALAVLSLLRLSGKRRSEIAWIPVQQRLDLEDMRTGFNYLQRFAKDVIKRSEK